MITNINLDDVFHALGHETRRAILDILQSSPGLSVGELAANFDVSRIAIMNHLNVLEKANLVISEKEGRARNLYMNVVPIQAIYDRWTNKYTSHFASRLTAIKNAAEQTNSDTQEDEHAKQQSRKSHL